MNGEQRFGMCERCAGFDQLSLTLEGSSRQYQWLCLACELASGVEWAAEHCDDVDRYQASQLDRHVEERSKGAKRVARDRGAILVVEDNDALRESLCRVLDEEGFVAAPASNGLIALRLLRHLEALPHIILLDLMMPLMNGWDFYRELLQDSSLSSVPVIVMTAHGGDTRTGELPVLRKPMTTERLLSAIVAACPP